MKVYNKPILDIEKVIIEDVIASSNNLSNVFQNLFNTQDSDNESEYPGWK